MDTNAQYQGAGANSRKWLAYKVACVDFGERVLEARHLLCALVGLERRISAAEQVVIVLDCGHLVVLGCELVCVISK